jgi:hypothetical protein
MSHAVFQCSNSAWVATRNERPAPNTRMAPQCPQTVGVPGSGSGCPVTHVCTPAIVTVRAALGNLGIHPLHCKREERGRAGSGFASIESAPRQTVFPGTVGWLSEFSNGTPRINHGRCLRTSHRAVQERRLPWRPSAVEQVSQQ